MSPEPVSTILLVNDDPDVLGMLEELLRRAGFRVLTAVAGQPAFEEAKRERPDLILSDVMMPGVDGLGLCRLVRGVAELSATPLVLYSAYRKASESALEGLRAGADDYLEMPIEPPLLVAKVTRLLERRRGEGAAEAGRRQLQFIADTASVYIAHCDAEGRFKFVNRTYAERLGLRRGDVVGKRISEVLGDEAYRSIEGYVSATLGGRPVEFEAEVPYREIGPRWMHCSYVPEAGERGEVTGFVAIITDVTERRRMEEDLRSQVEFTAALTGSLGEGLIAEDLEGRVTFMNPKAEELLGWTAGELHGERVHEVIHYQRPDGSPYPAEECPLEKVRMTGQSASVEDEFFTRRDGTIFPASLTVAPILRDGRVTGIVKCFQDQTRRRRAEEQLRQAQKLEAVGHLAGGVAHDFNNLLTAINGFSDLALRRAGGDDLLRLQLEEIKKAGERAAGLTRQLLAFSRKQMLQPKVLNLNDVIADTSRMLRRLIGEDVDLALHLDSGLGLVRADPGQVEQVLVNLAVNARDAMPRGGKIVIETGNVEMDEGAASTHAPVRPGPQVRVTVTDTGHGMDAGTKERVFEPFFTTKEVGKGTGLGLSTVYGIVKQSGGSISVYSEVGVGTTFKIYLPRVEAPAEAEKEEPVADAPRGTERVLLVEDDEMVRRLTLQVLAEYGYAVLEARNGAEAVTLCEREGGEIDLVLTDVVMPEMSGKELAGRLTALRPGVRVLYMSGYTNDAIVHHGVLEEGAHFMEKPFSPAALARKVREVLDQGAG